MNIKTDAMQTNTDSSKNSKSAYSIPGTQPSPEIEPSIQEIQEANLPLWVVIGLEYGGAPEPTSGEPPPNNIAGLIVVGLLSSQG